MPILTTIMSGLRSLFHRERADSRLNEELDGFVEMAVEEKRNDGMSRQEVLRAVRFERGSLEVLKEVVRSAGWESFVETCWQEFQQAVPGSAQIGRKVS
jgi:hypothetical protein